MGLRTAVTQARLVTFGVLAFGVWTLVSGLRVLDVMESLWAPSAAVGQTAVSGVAGLLVMAGILALLVVLYGELGETEPSPESWPPE